MDFKSIVNIIFNNKNKWHLVTDKDKEDVFFIFNRFMSKQYPLQSNFFNKKKIDKITAMDIWYNFLSSINKTPYWFWKGPTKKKAPKNKDWKLLQDYYKCSIEDIYYWIELFPKEVNKKIKQIKQWQTK